MQPVSYYRSAIGGDDVADMQTPLRVNCCGVVSLGQPFVTATPQGRRDYYFLYMAEGEMDIWIDGRGQKILPGDLVVYPPETGFRYSLAEGSMAYFWIHFTGYLAGGLMEKCGLKTNVLHHPGLWEDAVRTIHRLHRAFLTRGVGFDAECAGHLSVLLGKMGRRIDLAQAQSRTPSTERIQASLEYLHHHYSQPLTVATLAEVECLSPSRYGAVFRACMGVSPLRYLTDLRLRGAKELILTTDMSLGQISRAVGYEDSLYFSRLFRRVEGVPPSDYRRMVREDGDM